MCTSLLLDGVRGCYAVVLPSSSYALPARNQRIWKITKLPDDDDGKLSIIEANFCNTLLIHNTS